jgi:hypothetical protein
MRYRKKPVVIKAWKWDGDPCSFVQAPEWVLVDVGENGNFYIETLEGKMYVSPGDFIVKGVYGELYPCKPDIFDACYEKVEA